MVSRPAPALTKIGFRRDVRLFLLVLGGLFAVLIIALLFAVESAYSDAHDTRVQQWKRIADQAAEDVTAAKNRGLPVDSLATAIQARYGIESLQLTSRPPSSAVSSEATLTRKTPAGMLVLTFDDSALAALRRRMLATTAISLAGAAGGMILLLLYIPKITHPIEQMLDQARTIEARDPDVDEDQYLIETFRKSIETLKLQREELQQLHDAQKTRADEFERVTAALTRSLTSGLMAIDAAGVVVEINQAGREILRVPHDQPLSGRPADAIGDTALAAILQQSFDDRAALVRRQVETRTAAGDEIIVGVTTVPLQSDENSFLGMLALFTDLTEIRRLETRVRDLQSLADVGELSAGIAHEFRNSLSTILGYLKLAQRQSSPDEMRAKIHGAENEAAALGAAVDSLLNFARPMTIEMQDVDLRELVGDVVARLEPHSNGLEIAVSGDGKLAADPALLSRAVENVVRNAIDAIHAGSRAGRIAIVLSNTPPSIAITDNGIGIDSEAASRLFLPFQSRKPHGLGLGLPLARKIVLLNGGDIRVDGVPGEGTTVTMAFPRP